MTHNGTTKELKGETTKTVWPETRRGQASENPRPEHDDYGEETIIDRTLLDMIETLPKGLDFAARIAVFEEQATSMLTSLRKAVSERNRETLEDLAGKISRQAITVGAVRVLKISYELQSLARCSAYDDVLRLTDELEIEFLRAQASLRLAI